MSTSTTTAASPQQTPTEPRPSSRRRTLVAFVCGAAAVAVVGGGGVLVATDMGTTPKPAPSVAPVVPSPSVAPAASDVLPTPARPSLPAAPVTPAKPVTPVQPVTPVKPVTAASDPALAGAQQDLTKLGYYSGPIDGQMTAATAKALTAFQTYAKGQSYGGSVTVNGKFDPPTQYALNSALGGNAYGPGTGS